MAGGALFWRFLGAFWGAFFQKVGRFLSAPGRPFERPLIRWKWYHFQRNWGRSFGGSGALFWAPFFQKVGRFLAVFGPVFESLLEPRRSSKKFNICRGREIEFSNGYRNCDAAIAAQRYKTPKHHNTAPITQPPTVNKSSIRHCQLFSSTSCTGCLRLKTAL